MQAVVYGWTTYPQSYPPGRQGQPRISWTWEHLLILAYFAIPWLMLPRQTFSLKETPNKTT